MEQLNLSFWLGLAVAIPLSIAANLLTPRVQQWVGRRSSVKAERQSKLLLSQMEELERLTSEPGRLQTFLLESVLIITLLTSMCGVLSGVLFACVGFFPSTARLLLPMGQLLVVGGAIVVGRECIDTLRKSSRARNIEKFRVQVAKQLAELK
jgi:hypothetical protein